MLLGAGIRPGRHYSLDEASPFNQDQCPRRCLRCRKSDPMLLANAEMRFWVPRARSRRFATTHYSYHTTRDSLAPKANLESFVWVFFEHVVGGLWTVSSVTLELLTSLGAVEKNRTLYISSTRKYVIANYLKLNVERKRPITNHYLKPFI